MREGGLDVRSDKRERESYGTDGERQGGVVRAEDLVAAAWAALVSGRPTELRALEALLACPVEASPVAGREGMELQASVRRLEWLLAATARNLRILRGQWRMG